MIRLPFGRRQRQGWSCRPSCLEAGGRNRGRRGLLSGAKRFRRVLRCGFSVVKSKVSALGSVSCKLLMLHLNGLNNLKINFFKTCSNQLIRTSFKVLTKIYLGVCFVHRWKRVSVDSEAQSSVRFVRKNGYGRNFVCHCRAGVPLYSRDARWRIKYEKAKGV